VSETIVVDSSALLAVLFNEPGTDVMTAMLGDETRALMSAGNLAETVTKLVDRGLPDEAALATVESAAAIEIVPFTRAAANAAGLLRRHTRHLGLSVADRACLALGAAESAPVVTADRLWAQVNIGLEIRLIR
jgi:PIN domain nuclease of toxin-antitoxin system